MRFVSSDAAVNAEYTDQAENPETSDDTEFWRNEPSVRRLVVAPPAGRWRWRVCVGAVSLLLLMLIVVVSVSHVKFDRKFSSTELKMRNLTSTLLSLVSSTRDLEEFGHKLQVDLSTLELDQEKIQGNINDMSDSAQGFHDRLSELKCQIERIQNNNTQQLCCPDGWFLFSTHCYFFSDDGRPWDAARDECENRRAQLLILTSRQERSFVISKTKPLFYWLGLSDSRKGEWEWLDQTPYVMLRSEWMPGQPDDWKAHGLGGGEDCAHFHWDGRYNDDHCSRHYRYVCKARSSA